MKNSDGNCYFLKKKTDVNWDTIECLKNSAMGVYRCDYKMRYEHYFNVYKAFLN